MSSTDKKFFLILLFLFFHVFPSFSEDSPGVTAGMTGVLATESLDGQAYQLVGLMPDIGFGPLGVGLDLSFHFRFYDSPGGNAGFYPRGEDWYDSRLSVQQNVDKYLARILYLRWGKKGDPLYIQAGLLPRTVLGSGFIVGGYDNGALRPEIRYIGAEIDMDGRLIQFPYLGWESFVGNLSTFDVFGFRFYSRPLALFYPETAILKDLQWGITGAFDTNPYAQDPNSLLKPVTGTGAVTNFGTDLMAPLYSSEVFSVRASTDLVFQAQHPGAMVGLDGKALWIFFWGWQNRFMGDQFIPEYFDQGYDLNRTQKYAVYTGKLTVPGSVGWKILLGVALFQEIFQVQTSLEGPYGSPASSSVVSRPRLQGQALLKDGVLPVSLSAFYIKSNLLQFSDLGNPENAQIGAKIGYKIGSAVISLVYNLRYVPEDDPDYSGSHWKTSSRLETAVKF